MRGHVRATPGSSPDTRSRCGMTTAIQHPTGSTGSMTKAWHVDVVPSDLTDNAKPNPLMPDPAGVYDTNDSARANFGMCSTDALPRE